MQPDRHPTATLHQQLSSLLELLERLENAQYDYSCQCRPDRIPPDGMRQLLAEVASAVEAAVGRGMADEESSVFPLLGAAGEQPVIDALLPLRSRVILAANELHALTQRLTHENAASHCLDDDPWERLSECRSRLSNRLMCYLQLAESSYLPVVGYLLGDARNLPPGARAVQSRPQFSALH